MNQNHGPSPPVSHSQFHRFPLPTPSTYTTEKPIEIPPPKHQNLELIGKELGGAHWLPVSWNLRLQGRNFSPVPVRHLPWLGGSDLSSMAYPFVGSCRVLAQKDRILRGEPEPLLVAWPDLVFLLFLAGITATGGSIIDRFLGNGAFWICPCHFLVEICYLFVIINQGGRWWPYTCLLFLRNKMNGDFNQDRLDGLEVLVIIDDRNVEN